MARLIRIEVGWRRGAGREVGEYGEAGSVGKGVDSGWTETLVEMGKSSRVQAPWRGRRRRFRGSCGVTGGASSGTMRRGIPQVGAGRSCKVHNVLGAGRASPMMPAAGSIRGGRDL